MGVVTVVVVPAAVWPPGENWGGYAAASRSPSGGADGAARAATPPGGVDRDNSSSRAIASASASISRAATWPPIARYVQCSERLKGQLFYRCFQLVRTRHGPRAEPIVRVCRSTRQTFGFSRQTRAFMTQSRRSKSVPSLSFVAELDKQTSLGLPRQRVHNKASQDNDYTTNYRLTSEIEPIDPPRDDTLEPE